MALDRLYEDYPGYKIPDKWKDFDTWSRRGYNFLQSRIFYFKDQPEEMYYMTFIDLSITPPDSKQVIIAVRAVCQSNGMWLLEEDFDERERERIEQRFDDEIISKLETYTRTKARREK